ncbi:MAG: transaldolase [Longimicrobiales bacterium]
MAGMRDLLEHGQSVWLDYIRRGMVRDGELAGLVEDGLRGLTSNPTIFGKGIGETDEYDDELRAAITETPETTAIQLFERVAVQDIRDAADILRGVYDETGGADGFVSLEVSPYLAHRTDETIAQAKRLWKTVDRPNLMIKVPATPEGAVALEQLIAGGVNVNATLMFSLAHYEAIAQAFVRGAAQCTRPENIASVASFFVSRVDVVVDRKLDAMGTAEAKALRGKAAVANAKLAYARYQQIFDASFDSQRRRGVRAQRVLFGSTSTKDPAYSDVKYVEELIGPNTINTIPPETIEAFLDHGVARVTLTEDLDDARATMKALANTGIDMDEVTEFLLKDGVRKFAESFDEMVEAIETKRETILEPA